MGRDDVFIEPIDGSNWRKTLDVHAAAEQRRFVTDYEPVALVILAKAFVRAGERTWHPLAIRVQDKIVGVAALAQANKRCTLYHFLIDRDHQGQGIGKAAIGLIIAYVRQSWPTCTTLLLTVHPDNGAARTLYGSVGFEPTGEVINDEPVFELFLDQPRPPD